MARDLSVFLTYKRQESEDALRVVIAAHELSWIARA